MIELKEKPKCCDKDMHYEKEVQNFGNEDVQQYVCLECGGFVTISEGQLDKEELDNFKDTYGVK